jgi:hypothetical protein
LRRTPLEPADLGFETARLIYKAGNPDTISVATLATPQ